MAHENGVWFISLSILVFALSIPRSHSLRITKNKIKTKSAVFLSPKFELGPGIVNNKNYYNIGFPKGHIALKRFDAEVVDEAGDSVPLYETYLHHWIILRYYIRKGVDIANVTQADFRYVRNSGACEGNTLGQYYGLGSETRKTPTHVPDPYGIEIGNPEQLPEGFEEGWMVNLHAIDTRGTVDALGCLECRCDLYNVTKDADGQPLPKGYIGGLDCCFDQTQCQVKKGFYGARRGLYLKYTVEWADWSDFILPVWIYIFDVTDTWTGLKSAKHNCLVEYDVLKSNKTTSNDSIETKKNYATISTGKYLIYGVAHQHTGGIGATVYGQDGRVICSSTAIYGNGTEAGNEAGYIVGMSTCYPKPGSIKILAGERLVHESIYHNNKTHTGVMGLFYILVADKLPN